MNSKFKIEVKNISSSNDVLFFLDFPKNNQSFDDSLFRVRGWAYAPSDQPVSIVVKSRGLVEIHPRSIYRSDVMNYLKMKGHLVDDKSTHGFDIKINEDDINIGFCIGEDIIYTHKIIKRKGVKFEEANSLSYLFTMEEGVYRNFYFHNTNNWEKIIIFFNGALTPNKVRAEGTIFQRWSWAKKFKYPVLCVADPLTIGENRIPLGWYLGGGEENLLASILSQIGQEVREVCSDTQLVGIGSSGGGFAAIAGTVLGYLDEAIVMNPQTDILLFEVRSAVLDFMAKRGYRQGDFDLKKYDFLQLKKDARVIYTQNLHDEHHKDVHYEPFRSVVEKNNYMNNFKFIEYKDEAAGHTPPSFDGMKQLIGAHFSDLLK